MYFPKFQFSIQNNSKYTFLYISIFTFCQSLMQYSSIQKKRRKKNKMNNVSPFQFNHRHPPILPS